ncbi:MAG: pyridoxal phosphate-dependent aminotransferase [Alphaproteobacteria bacterium]|nr:pyridoxal phosphate-dependent aminotransferase [Alphaproteobacteria bacterium]
MEFISHRMVRIKPSPTLEISARAAKLKALGNDVIGLAAGEPDFNTPQHIIDAATKAMTEGKTKYTAVEGTVALRRAVAKKFAEENNIHYEPAQIIVGDGAKHVIFNAFFATLNPGDEVIIPAPFWVSYPDMVELAEGTPVIVRSRAEDSLKLTPESLEENITPRTKWVILNSPNNPSGMVYEKQELEALAGVLRRFPHVHILSDDIYEHLVYDGVKFHTLVQVAPDLKERILTVNGVSKTYAMTGWRIGYGAGPHALIEAMTIIQSQSTSNANSIAQEAAVAALEGPQDFLVEWKKVYAERRDKAFEILKAIPGLTCIKPQGAFYIYPSCAALMGKQTPSGDTITSDTDLATYLLEAVGVAVVPGVAFGLSPAFRVSYAMDTDLLLEACHRISQAIQVLR